MTNAIAQQSLTEQLYTEEYHRAVRHGWGHTYAFDLRNILARPEDRAVSELILTTLCVRVPRNFSEPTLRLLNIKGRTKTLKFLREHDCDNFRKIAMFNLALGRLPKDKDDLTLFDSSGLSNFMYGGYGWKQPTPSADDMFAKTIEGYKQIVKILDQASVWEWASFYVEDMGVSEFGKQLDRTNGMLKKLTSQDLLPLNKPFNMNVTDYDTFLETLIGLGLRPAP